VPDQSQAPTEAHPPAQETPPSAQETLSEEISASLSSVWARYAGSRPADARVVIEGTVVRWTLPEGKADLETGMNATNEGLDAGQPAKTLPGYERETSAVVSRATRCPVRARITKQNAQTGAATETFILEAPTRKY
jgi:hypothetical protein